MESAAPRSAVRPWLNVTKRRAYSVTPSSAQILEQREPPHDLRILEIKAFPEQVALEQIAESDCAEIQGRSWPRGEGVARQTLVARPFEPQQRRRRLDGRHAQVGAEERNSLRDQPFADPLKIAPRSSLVRPSSRIQLISSSMLSPAPSE